MLLCPRLFRFIHPLAISVIARKSQFWTQLLGFPNLDPKPKLPAHIRLPFNVTCAFFKVTALLSFLFTEQAPFVVLWMCMSHHENQNTIDNTKGEKEPRNPGRAFERRRRGCLILFKLSFEKIN